MSGHRNIAQELQTYLLQTVAAAKQTIVELKPEDSFMDKGILDSLSLLDFIVFIEKRYGIKIPGEEIVPETFGSLAAVTAYLESRLEKA